MQLKHYDRFEFVIYKIKITENQTAVFENEIKNINKLSKT